MTDVPSTGDDDALDGVVQSAKLTITARVFSTAATKNTSSSTSMTVSPSGAICLPPKDSGHASVDGRHVFGQGAKCMSN